MKKCMWAVLCVVLCSCQRGPSEVMDKVLVDFGVREKPEGYETGSDKVAERLNDVGQTELKRLNLHSREGKIAFQEGQGLGGKFYKEVKVYEDARPVDAQAVSKAGSSSDRGYVGLIDFTYRIYQSERRSTRAEAAALDADVPTNQSGRERYRYTFTPAGTWNGGEGELVKQ